MKKKSSSSQESVKIQQLNRVSKRSGATGYSRKHSPPEDLERLIKLTNQVPEGTKTLRELKRIAGRDWNMLDSLIFQEVEKFPAALRELLLSPPDMRNVSPDLYDKALRLQWMRAGRDKFYRAFEYLSAGREMLAAIADSRRRSWGLYDLEFWVKKDEAGRLQLASHPLLDCLLNVEVERIGRCPVCEKIYWAERIDQPTCSVRHNDIRHSNIQRGKYIETRERCLKTPLAQKDK